MINLLPTETKQNILFGRRNSKLLRWTAFGLCVIAGFGVITVFGQLYIRQVVNNTSVDLERDRQQLKDQKLEEVQKQVESISGNLKLIEQVLSKEVLFSELIQAIGSAIPRQAVLNNISLSTVEGGIDLTASAKDYTTATQVQVNLQDPENKIFDKVDIVSINCNQSPSGDSQAVSPQASGYPCVVNLRAQFAANTPFLFINKNEAAQ